MKKIALLTCDEEPTLWDDDVLLLNDLNTRGYDARPVVWDSNEDNLDQYAFAIIRSIWDYHRKVDKFLSWLNSMDSKGIRLYNDIPTIRFNLNKIYLKDLFLKGVPIIPSIFVNPHEIPEIDLLFDKLSSDEIIIKPLVGASSHGIIKLTKGYGFDFENYITEHKHGFIIQKFISQVAELGEVSLVFFHGQYSHCVHKIPAKGDFRVQDDYGGTFNYISPDDLLRQKAKEILDLLPVNPVYARIDCLYSKELFYLMEIELIEPILYLHNKVYRDNFIKILDYFFESD